MLCVLTLRLFQMGDARTGPMQSGLVHFPLDSKNHFLWANRSIHSFIHIRRSLQVENPIFAVKKGPSTWVYSWRVVLISVWFFSTKFWELFTRPCWLHFWSTLFKRLNYSNIFEYVTNACSSKLFRLLSTCLGQQMTPSAATAGRGAVGGGPSGSVRIQGIPRSVDLNKNKKRRLWEKYYQQVFSAWTWAGKMNLTCWNLWAMSR